MRITIEMDPHQFNAVMAVAHGIIGELGWIRELLAKRCDSGFDPATLKALTDKLKASEAALRAAIEEAQTSTQH